MGMNGPTVPVTVEWALWGKPRDGMEYRVLPNSDGVISAADFEEMLARYSPGMPDTLPQVTMSWLYNEKRRQYFTALTIYEAGANDRGGRNTVLARCYCGPYDQLARGAVSYWDMFTAFSQTPLPDDNRGVLRLALPGSGADGAVSPLARLSAAMLLTGRPVCILGADDIECAERVRFLDSVISLLPYGLRARLSASTWVSSLFHEHKFRLYFSTAGRKGDYTVRWGHNDAHAATGHRDADSYLSWLVNDARNPVTALATLTQPADFSSHDIEDLLKMVSTWHQRSAPVPPLPKATPEPVSFEELLAECDEVMRGHSPALKRRVIADIAQYNDDQVTDRQRQRYQRIIKDRQLFGDDPGLSMDLQDKLYSALLRNAFGMPLTYDAYRQVEDCAGQHMHRSLLLTIKAAEIPDVVRLLVTDALGEEPTATDTPPALVLAATLRQLALPHLRVLYLISLRHLRDDDADVADSILQDAFYLMPVLRKLFPRDREARLKQLQGLLRLCYGESLNRQTIYRILGTEVPWIDLLYAVALMTPDPEDVKFAELLFARRYASWAYPESGSRLLEVLAKDYHPVDDSPVDHSSAHGGVLVDDGQTWRRAHRPTANLPRVRMRDSGLGLRHNVLSTLIASAVLAALCVAFVLLILNFTVAHR
jgi:hypothetical protein